MSWGANPQVVLSAPYLMLQTPPTPCHASIKNYEWRALSVYMHTTVSLQERKVKLQKPRDIFCIVLKTEPALNMLAAVLELPHTDSENAPACVLCLCVLVPLSRLPIGPAHPFIMQQLIWHTCHRLVIRSKGLEEARLPRGRNRASSAWFVSSVNGLSLPLSYLVTFLLITVNKWHHCFPQFGSSDRFGFLFLLSHLVVHLWGRNN